MLQFLAALLPKSLQKVSTELAPETMSELGEDLSQVNASLETASARESDLQAQVTALQAQLDQANTQLSQITAERDQLATNLQSATQKATQLQGLIDDFQAKSQSFGKSDATSQEGGQLTYSQKLLSEAYGINL